MFCLKSETAFFFGDIINQPTVNSFSFGKLYFFFFPKEKQEQEAILATHRINHSRSNQVT